MLGVGGERKRDCMTSFLEAKNSHSALSLELQFVEEREWDYEFPPQLKLHCQGLQQLFLLPWLGKMVTVSRQQVVPCGHTWKHPLSSLSKEFLFCSDISALKIAISPLETGLFLCFSHIFLQLRPVQLLPVQPSCIYPLDVSGYITQSTMPR